MSNQKPRVIKDFEKLDEGIQEQIKLENPDGFSTNLIFFHKQGWAKSKCITFRN